MLLNNGSLCIQMKSNISPDQYDATCSQQTKAINEWPSDEEFKFKVFVVAMNLLEDDFVIIFRSNGSGSKGKLTL